MDAKNAKKVVFSQTGVAHPARKIVNRVLIKIPATYARHHLFLMVKEAVLSAKKELTLTEESANHVLMITALNAMIRVSAQSVKRPIYLVKLAAKNVKKAAFSKKRVAHFATKTVNRVLRKIPATFARHHLFLTVEEAVLSAKKEPTLPEVSANHVLMITVPNAMIRVSAQSVKHPIYLVKLAAKSVKKAAFSKTKVAHFAVKTVNHALLKILATLARHH